MQIKWENVCTKYEDIHMESGVLLRAWLERARADSALCLGGEITSELYRGSYKLID
jgi:hypothetical protein